MREYELKWLLDLHFEFSKERGIDPDLISDWEPDTKNFKFPEKLVHESLLYNELNFHYHFLYALKPIKEKVANYYNELNTYSEKLDTDGIAIVPGITSALYLTLLAFKKKGLTKGLGVRPIYFSIRDTCNDLSINLDLIDSYSNEAYVANLEEIIQKLQDGSYDFFILTNPVYCAGMQLDPSYIAEIQRVCTERNVLLVMDEAFIIPWGKGAKNFKSYSTTQTVVIRSPMKALFINGLKVATVTGPTWLIGDIEGNSTHVLGSITYPQLSLADHFFSQAPEVIKEIQNCEKSNYVFLKHNYAEVGKLVQNHTTAHLVEANSNPYGMIECSNISNNKETLANVIKAVLTETGCMILPSWRYSFTVENNPFAFRINLARANENYINKLKEILDKLASI